MAIFGAFVFRDLTGVIVHDRYQNYDKFPGVARQLCAVHLLRDLADSAQSYPGVIWPAQAAEALHALIHHVNLARDAGLAAVPPETAAPHLRLFRHVVRAGLAQVCRIGTPSAATCPPPRSTA
jgi:transposase